MTQSNTFDDFDRFEAYEKNTKRRYATKRSRRKLKQKAAYEGKSEAEAVAKIQRDLEIEDDFALSFTLSMHDYGWVMSAIKPFFEEDLITDVIAQVKGGKEANVYQAVADPSLEVAHAAVKVYRPKMFRSLSNDAMYRDGRATVDADGSKIKPNDKRSMKAMKHKSKFGDYLKITSWMQYEYATLKLLREAGVRVPEVFAINNNAILMAFIGDENGAAPLLHSVNLRKQGFSSAEIITLFNTTIDYIDIMLQHDLIHGDLSAFNILFHEQDVVLIDFPQAVSASKNGRARSILARDVTRVCDYFKRQGVDCRPHAITDALWSRYNTRTAQDRLADMSRIQAEAEG